MVLMTDGMQHEFGPREISEMHILLRTEKKSIGPNESCHASGPRRHNCSV